MMQVPVGRRAYLLGRRATSAGGAAALRGAGGAAAGQRVVLVDGEPRRAVRLRSAAAKQEEEGKGEGQGQGQGTAPAPAARGSVSVDGAGFHEIRESVAQSEDHARRFRDGVSGATSAAAAAAAAAARPTVAGARRRAKVDVMARLDELARLEAEADAATAAKHPRPAADRGLEIAALGKRVAEIKSVDDYDEDDALMSELKSLRARLRLLNTSSAAAAAVATPAVPAPRSKNITATVPSPSPSPSANPAVLSLKEAGNKAFKDKDYGTAISQYTEALALARQDASEEEHLLLSNRSLCFCKARFYREAERDARRIVQQKPKWAKGYYRLASAMFEGLNENALVPGDILEVVEEGLAADAKNKGLCILRKKVAAMISGGEKEQKNTEKKKKKMKRASPAPVVAPSPRRHVTEKTNTAAFPGRVLERGVSSSASVHANTAPVSKKSTPKAPGKPMSAFMRRRLGIAEEEKEPVARPKAVSRPYF